MLRIRAKAFRAPEAVGNCLRSADVHAQVLRKYDIGNVTSAKDGWWKNEQTYAVLLEETKTGEPLGGVRLQRWGNGVPLPIESALADVDRYVHAWVASFASAGVGELCGLWCSPRIKGFGIGGVLTKMGMSLASELKTRTILGLCDTRNVATNVGFGFARDATLASEGSFEYPRPGLCAHVLRVPDARRLEGAIASHRIAVESYRRVPVGLEILEAGGQYIELERDLRVTSLEAPAQRRAHASRPNASAQPLFLERAPEAS
jgi:hypothetical protein